VSDLKLPFVPFFLHLYKVEIRYFLHASQSDFEKSAGLKTIRGQLYGGRYLYKPNEDGTKCVYIYANTRSRQLSCLAHECVHAGLAILHSVGVPISQTDLRKSS